MAGFGKLAPLRVVLSGAGVLVIALLSACDNGPSAVRQQAAGTQMATAAPASPASRSGAAADTVDHRNDPVAAASDGKPIWATSKRYGADEGARRAFERNGEAFGASSVDQFVMKAHAFVGHPPKGTQTLTRQNGDTLFYDPKGNVFAVADKNGAPRTMFKPDDGEDYWRKQKAAEAKSARTARRSSPSGDDA